MCSIQTIASPRPRSDLDCFDQAVGFLVGEAAADLVEQQHARLGRERARKLQPLAIEQPERFRPAIGDVQHLAKLKRLDAALVSALTRQGRRRSSRRRSNFRTRSCRRTGRGI